MCGWDMVSREHELLLQLNQMDIQTLLINLQKYIVHSKKDAQENLWEIGDLLASIVVYIFPFYDDVCKDKKHEKYVKFEPLLSAVDSFIYAYKERLSQFNRDALFKAVREEWCTTLESPFALISPISPLFESIDNENRVHLKSNTFNGLLDRPFDGVYGEYGEMDYFPPNPNAPVNEPRQRKEKRMTTSCDKEIYSQAVEEIKKCFEELGQTRKNNPECYRHDIFSKRELADWETPQYAWQWNFTIAEYDNIKQLLNNHALVLKDVIKQNKICCKLLQLYVSEWYKRDFNGNDKRGNAYSLIGVDDLSEEICKQLLGDKYKKRVFHDNADNTGDSRYRDTIYVDGGLPLKYLLSEGKGEGFTRSIRKIIEENDYGNNDIACDLGDLCNNGVINQSYQARVLHPKDNDASIFDFIQEKIVKREFIVSGFENFEVKIQKEHDKAEKERRHRIPFEIKWIFDFDDNGKTVDIYYQMNGPQLLSEDFINEHKLKEAQYITVSVKCNNNDIYTIEYDNRHYCRRNVKYRGQYRIGDEITIEIAETEEILLTHELDLSDPKLLSLKDSYDNTYTLCDSKEIAFSDCRAIAMGGWTSENLRNENYFIGTEIYKVFFIEQTHNPTIINNDSESKTFDPKKPLCWTIIDQKSAHRTQLLTKEPLYDARNMIFFKGEGDKIDRKPQKVKFASKGSRVWGDTPKLGEIRARIDMGNESVDPVKFINVRRLSITKEASDQNTCVIRIEWEGGGVTSTEATSLQKNDCWHISKNQLANPNYVTFLFTPNKGEGEKFQIHIHPTFDDFKILDPNLEEVKPNSVIPMVDLHNYHYYLRGNSINLRFCGNNGKEDNEEELQYRDNPENGKIAVSLYSNTDRSRTTKPDIPYEGFLSTFFGGTNAIRDLLERNTLPITKSTVEVHLYKNRLNIYYFKDFPYRIIQNEENCLLVSESVNDHVLPPYTGQLLAIPIDNPSVSPITILAPFNIPDEMLAASNKQWLIYGDLQGLILPKLIDLECVLSDEERANLKRENVRRFKVALKADTMFGDQWIQAFDWYDLFFQGNIPGCSMLTLVAIADDQELLVKFAIQLFIRFKSLQEELTENMLEFQRQMDLLWAWVHINVVDLSTFVDFKQPYLVDYYNEWELQHNPDNFISIEKQTEEQLGNCRQQLMDGFDAWFNDLKEKSIPQPLYTDPHLNALGDGLQTQQARDFFNQIPVNITLPPYQKWISQRHKFHEMADQIDVFDLDCDPSVKKEIHRSIIYGLKFKYNE